MKEYERHLQCEVRVSCNLRKREHERNERECVSTKESPNWWEGFGLKPGIRTWSAERGPGRVSDAKVCLPNRTHCLGMAWSIAVGSLLYFHVRSFNGVPLSLGICPSNFPLLMSPSSQGRGLLFVHNWGCEIIAASTPCFFVNLESKS